MGDPNAMSDETLMRLLAGGDSFAIETLYERHSSKLYSLALRIMGDSQGAEEVMQDTFFQLWRKSSQYDPERGSLIGWLLTMTRHRAISRIREQKDRLQCESPLVDPVARPGNMGADFLDQEFARELISAAFAGLPEAQRHAIRMAYFEKCSVTYGDNR
jgi:RNA polymerase sigma-70 factor (ECF subfamily)